jgi:hypothetical protein
MENAHNDSNKYFHTSVTVQENKSVMLSHYANTSSVGYGEGKFGNYR